MLMKFSSLARIIIIYSIFYYTLPTASIRCHGNDKCVPTLTLCGTLEPLQPWNYGTPELLELWNLWNFWNPGTMVKMASQSIISELGKSLGNSSILVWDRPIHWTAVCNDTHPSHCTVYTKLILNCLFNLVLVNLKCNLLMSSY